MMRTLFCAFAALPFGKGCVPTTPPIRRFFRSKTLVSRLKKKFRAGRAFRFCAALVIGLAALTAFGRPAFAQEPPPPPPPPDEANVPPTEKPEKPADGTAPAPPPSAPTPPAQGGGRYLLLPDISLNGIFLGHLSTDKRDQERDRFRLDQAELAVQSYVYPEIKLDTFIVFNGNGGGVNVEEAYLTYQRLPVGNLPLSAVLGRRKVPFGRVNQLHPHSWLYAVQPYVLTNLVSSESLTGDGAYLSYLLPTGKLFAQLDAGFYTQSESTEDFSFLENSGQLITSPGAGFADKFGTVRLLLAADAFGGSAELGGSLAGGRGALHPLSDGPDGGPIVHPDILLTGLDLTYRKSGRGASRLLLRGEYVNHRQKDGDYRRSTSGYYLFADQRLDGFNSVGLRYDDSGFPYADGRERGISLIGTHQITEATLYRLQYTHGSRPGKSNFDELHFELIFGVGPHTHNLE